MKKQIFSYLYRAWLSFENLCCNLFPRNLAFVLASWLEDGFELHALLREKILGTNFQNLIVRSISALMFMLSHVNATSPASLDQPKTEDVLCLPNVASNTSGNWHIFADALCWYASEQASAVWIDIIDIGVNTSSFTAQDIGFDWDFGFRLGTGYNFKRDQWDTQLYWTWFRTETDQSKKVFPEFIPIGGGVLVTEEMHPEFFAADLSGDFAAGAHIRWSLLFNMFDWELGRNYWVSKGLSLRPFIGIKGGWIHQSIDVHYKDLIVNSAPTDTSAKERVKNDFWGVGPVGGVNTQWKLRDFGTHFPSLFGDFSVATLWGTWACDDVYRVTTGKKVDVQSRNAMLGALMLRGFLGAGWDVAFNKAKSHFAARLGFETQLWVNQLRVATSQLVRLHGDLTLQGVTFNCDFDF